MTKKPKPEPGAPRDWGHHQAKLAEHLDRLEARLIVVEAMLQNYEQAEETELLGRYTAPPGVVPPHVRENLEALAAWTEVRLHEQSNPEKLIEHLGRMIAIALEGGDVPRPLP